MKSLNQEEALRLLDTARESAFPYSTLFELALMTGMRRGEVVALQWDNVDLDLNAVYVTSTLQRVAGAGLTLVTTKTARSRRRVALGDDVVDLLRRHHARQAEQRLLAGPAWQEGDWVFTRPDGRPVDPDWVTHRFAALAKQAGLAGIRLHDLRHTHASLMLANGENPKVVSERLGHASIVITMDTYSHVLPGLQEEAARKFSQAFRRVK